MKRLTKIQVETLDYIKAHSETLGYAPSIKELSQRFDISLNAVTDRLCGLEKKGIIQRTNGVARSIVVLE